MEPAVVEIITDGSALAILGLVLYFGWRLLDNLVQVVSRHLEEIERTLSSLRDEISTIKDILDSGYTPND